MIYDDINVEVVEAEKVRKHEREAGLVNDPWPDPPNPLAYHGIFGRIVDAIDPVTQADPVAVLVNLVIMFGSASGRTAYFKADGARHYANLFAVLVGSTSRGAKGTSTAQAEVVMKVADPEWGKERIRGGLASGEGITFHVRDGNGKDEGVTDKRLLAKETEFASVLKKAAREGSILSSTIRQAWDTGNLGNLAIGNSLKATGAHVSLIGHITPDELLRYMTSTETANGFGNRVLWISTRRSKSLADGGWPDPRIISELSTKITETLDFVRTMGEVEIKRTPAAAELWRLAYPIIDIETPGLIGALTARTPSQICRVALVFALADRRREIGPDHLLAAMSLVDFSNRSAAFIFGTGMGDKVQDEILACLHDAGTMTKAEMFGALQRHVSRDQLNRALDALDRAGRVVRVSTRPTGPGRPPETWAASQNRELMRKTPLGLFIEAHGGISRINSQVSRESGPDL